MHQIHSQNRNRSQVNKKTKSNFKYIFQENQRKKNTIQTTQRGKIHNIGKYGREGQKEKKGSTLEEGPGAGMLIRILAGEVRDKTESTGCAGGKGSTGLWNETQAKQQWLAEKQEGEQKLIRNKGLLATRRP